MVILVFILELTIGILAFVYSNKVHYVFCFTNILPHVREFKTVLDSRFQALDSGLLSLDSGFQSLVGSHIPWATTSKIFPDNFRFHEPKFLGFWIPNSLALGKTFTQTWLRLRFLLIKDVKEYVIVQSSTCMIGITHLQNVLILPHTSHFNNITDLNVSKCIVVWVGRTSSNTLSLRLLISDQCILNFS